MKEIVVLGRHFKKARGSDLERDGMFIEFSEIKEDATELISEVFYSDRTNCYTVNTFVPNIPIGVLEELTRIARRYLGKVDDRIEKKKTIFSIIGNFFLSAATEFIVEIVEVNYHSDKKGSCYIGLTDGDTFAALVFDGTESWIIFQDARTKREKDFEDFPYQLNMKKIADFQIVVIRLMEKHFKRKTGA